MAAWAEPHQRPEDRWNLTVWSEFKTTSAYQYHNSQCQPRGGAKKNKKVFVFTPSNVLNYTLSNAIILFCPGNPNNERTVFLINDVNADWVCL